MKKSIYEFLRIATVVGGVVGGASLVGATDVHMSLENIGGLATSTLSDFGTQVLAVLTAVIGVAIAYFLFKFAWKHIKGSVR